MSPDYIMVSIILVAFFSGYALGWANEQVKTSRIFQAHYDNYDCFIKKERM